MTDFKTELIQETKTMQVELDNLTTAIVNLLGTQKDIKQRMDVYAESLKFEEFKAKSTVTMEKTSEGKAKYTNDTMRESASVDLLATNQTYLNNKKTHEDEKLKYDNVRVLIEQTEYKLKSILARLNSQNAVLTLLASK